MGWTDAEMAVADPRTVAALSWRIEAEHLWSSEARQMYHAGPLNSSDAKANSRHNAARRAAQQVHALLFPEDD